MIPHKQLFKHDPANGVYGDCQRTVLACLLDKEGPADVPHFGEDGVPDGVFWDRVNAWLAVEGYKIWNTYYPGETSLEDVLRTQGILNPGVYYMLAGKSRNGTDHVVICMGNGILHDPAQDDSGIVGPDSQGHYRVEVLIPICQTTLQHQFGIDQLDRTFWPESSRNE